eukprot:3553654-Prymnesium_polylepis.1
MPVAAALLATAVAFNEVALPELMCLSTGGAQAELARDLLNLFTEKPTAALEKGPWVTNSIITRLVEILGREKLNYAVSVRDFVESSQTSAAAYTRLSKGDVDINVELWPLAAPKIRTDSVQGGGITPLLKLGFTGQSGWYVPVAASRASVPRMQRVYTDPNGTLLSDDLVDPIDFLRRLSPAAVKLLTPAAEMTTVDVCSAISADMANAANGTYDCVHGTWTPPEPLACTPRGQLGTAPPCAALV